MPVSLLAQQAILQNRPTVLSVGERAAARRYGALLAAAKADPAHMDWAALRLAYAGSPNFDPAAGNAVEMHNIMIPVMQGNWAQTAALAEAAIAKNWMNMPAHFAASAAYRNLGNQAALAKEQLIIKAFMEGVIRGHDGKSPATALAVLAVPEEYLILTVVRWKRQRQVLRTIDGHEYDILTCVHPPDTNTFDIYFAIDLMRARENARVMGALLITDDQIPN